MLCAKYKQIKFVGTNSITKIKGELITETSSSKKPPTKTNNMSSCMALILSKLKDSL